MKAKEEAADPADEVERLALRGAKAICSGTGDPDKFTGEVSPTALRDARAVVEAIRNGDEGRSDDRLREALELHVTYEATPADRGGKSGPKGRAYAAFIEARDAALEAPTDKGGGR